MTFIRATGIPFPLFDTYEVEDDLTCHRAGAHELGRLWGVSEGDDPVDDRADPPGGDGWSNLGFDGDTDRPVLIF
jgi:hypothetical protein